MSDSGIVWEEPPKPKTGNRPVASEWPERLAPLMERPNEWARVGDFAARKTASNIATRIRRRSHWRPPGQWEFRGVSDAETGTSRLYARYLGADDGKKP